MEDVEMFGGGDDDVLERNHQVQGVDVENRTCNLEGRE